MTRTFVLAALLASILPVASARADDRVSVGNDIPFAGPYTPHFPPYYDASSAYGYYSPYYAPYGGLYSAPTSVNAAPPAAYFQPAQIYGQPFSLVGQAALGQVFVQPAATPGAPMPLGKTAPQK
jgi:hypothetical protein